MKIDFTKGGGLIPAIIQDARTNAVLMLGFMNEEALSKTRAEGFVTFYSRSKQRLWMKGETSGHRLLVEEILIDCDQDTLLIKARPEGAVCHTGQDTCFGERNEVNGDFLERLARVIEDRRLKPRAESYTSKLFAAGLDRMLQKVGEEAVELVIAGKNAEDDVFLNEAADLLYHFLVLLSAKGRSLADVRAVLSARHAGAGSSES